MHTMVSQEIKTAEQLLQMPEDGSRYELVGGAVCQMSPAGFWHGHLLSNLTFLLKAHIWGKGVGVVPVGNTGFVLNRNPDTVRAPDLAFVVQSRVPDSEARGFEELVPDLVAEIVSPNDRYAAVQEKVAEWVAAGVRMVLVVDPTSRSLTVHRESGTVVLIEGDVLHADDVVPGWCLAVSELFVGC